MGPEQLIGKAVTLQVLGKPTFYVQLEQIPMRLQVQLGMLQRIISESHKLI